MSDPSANPGGIISSLRRMLKGGLALVEARIELFGVELREEQCRLVEIIILAATLVAIGILICTLLTLLVVVVFWESARMAAIGGPICLYIIAGVLVWRRLGRRLKSPTPFSGTLGELRKDRACLGPEP